MRTDLLPGRVRHSRRPPPRPHPGEQPPRSTPDRFADRRRPRARHTARPHRSSARQAHVRGPPGRLFVGHLPPAPASPSHSQGTRVRRTRSSSTWTPGHQVTTSRDWSRPRTSGSGPPFGEEASPSSAPRLPCTARPCRWRNHPITSSCCPGSTIPHDRSTHSPHTLPPPRFASTAERPPCSTTPPMQAQSSNGGTSTPSRPDRGQPACPAPCCAEGPHRSPPGTHLPCRHCGHGPHGSPPTSPTSTTWTDGSRAPALTELPAIEDTRMFFVRKVSSPQSATLLDALDTRA